MKRLNIFILLLSVASFTSCKKYLDTNPDMRTEINTVEKVAQLVSTAYPQTHYLAMAEMYSDNVSDKGLSVAGTHVNLPYPQMYRWEDVNENGDNTPTQYWNGVYKGIAAANQALESIEKYQLGAAANPYKGEALIARAYAHWMLVTFFSKPYEPGQANDSAGIPYVMDPETKPVVKYDRGTVASVYEQVEKDLLEGLKLIEGGNWKVPKYHFTPAAAHAFAARFYLFKNEWQKVVDHTNQIFVGGNFRGSLRDYVNEASKLNTVDFNAYFTKADKKFNLLLREVRTVYQRGESFPTSRYGFSPAIFTNLYSSNAKNPIIPSGGDKANFIGRTEQWGLGNYTTYIWREYFYMTNATAQIGEPYIMLPLFTADEALMNRAEAYVQLGKINEAIADCNLFAEVRKPNFQGSGGVTVDKSKTFFKVNTDKDAILQTILHFKRVAFMSEGIRWFDILRHKITVKHDFIGNAGEVTYEELGPEDPRRAFQIPESAITLGGLTANPR